MWGRDEKVQVGLDYVMKMWQIPGHGLLWLVVAATVHVFIAANCKDVELQAFVKKTKPVSKRSHVNGI